MIEKDKDIVSDILDRVDQALTDLLVNELGFEQSLADAISQRIQAQDTNIRRDWGSSKPYIEKRTLAEKARRKAALEEVDRTGKVAEASKKHGIARPTLYNLLKR